MSYLLIIAATIFCSLLPAWGQRLFAKVDPASIEPNLKFDINDLPLVSKAREDDLNFSPNVVFAPDTSKAFVSYPGSDKIVVFDPKTGAILSLIEVGTNPTLITLTPDGKNIAVPSIFFADNVPQAGSEQGKLLGSISIIDIATLEVRTLTLDKVFFSFVNNIVFSADSKTGFIASSGTDEIVRFDVETAAELPSRLKVKEGGRPSAITMAADFSFFAVVLVGSPFLDKQAVPDSIEIIDTASFSIKKTIVLNVPPGQLAHDFFGVNRVALSLDGKVGLIADREISLRVPVSGSIGDHALLFDVEKGEIITLFLAVGAPSSSYLTPDGKTFVVIGRTALALINLEDQTMSILHPIVSRFNLTTRPAFSQDSSQLFVAAPIDDQILTLDLQNNIFRRAVNVGGLVEFESGGTTFLVSSAPLDLAFSPDEKVLTAVNFNANTVDLLRLTKRFFVPHLLSNSEWFTGVAVTNNSPSESEIIFHGIDRIGRPFQDDPETPEVVEFVNPVTVKLAAGKQTAFTARGLFPGSSTLEGWLDSDSSESQVSGFFVTGDRNVKRLDGALIALAPASSAVLPEARVTDGFRTEISIANPNFGLANVNISLFGRDGTKLGERDRPVSTGHVLTTFLRDRDPDDEESDGLFLEPVFEGFVNGYVTITSPERVITFERYFDGERLAALNGIVVAGPNSELHTTLYLAQVVAFAGAETFLNLIHTGAEEATVTLTLKGDQGTDLAGPVILEMGPGHAVRTSIVPLFGLIDPGGAVAGWVLVESDEPSLVGDAEIQIFSGKAMTTIPAQGKLLQQFVFSHVAEDLGLSTGVALLNPGSVAATVQVEVFDPEGTLVASLQLLLEPGEREVKLLKEWFVDFPQLSGGYIKVSSTQGIVGLELFFADNQELMAAVPAQELL